MKADLALFTDCKRGPELGVVVQDLTKPGTGGVDQMYRREKTIDCRSGLVAESNCHRRIAIRDQFAAAVDRHVPQCIPDSEPVEMFLHVFTHSRRSHDPLDRKSTRLN